MPTISCVCSCQDQPIFNRAFNVFFQWKLLIYAHGFFTIILHLKHVTSFRWLLGSPSACSLFDVWEDLLLYSKNAEADITSTANKPNTANTENTRHSYNITRSGGTVTCGRRRRSYRVTCRGSRRCAEKEVESWVSFNKSSFKIFMYLSCGFLPHFFLLWSFVIFVCLFLIFI